MRRPTAFSTVFAPFRAILAGTIVLAAAVSCDTYTTSTMETPSDGSVRVRVNPTRVIYTSAQKDSIAAVAAMEAGSFSSMVPLEPIGNVVGTPTSAAASVAACGGTGTFNGYSKSHVPFSPEAIPNIVPYPVPDDGWIKDDEVPLGFSFNFQGQTFDKVNVSSNGLLLFGTVPSTNSDGYPSAGFIPSRNNPNNIIALAWTDWQPDMVPDPVRWETRGTAPDRKFILQFNNVPEYNDANAPGAISAAAGRVTAQVVLSEGSNDITIYTNQLATNRLQNGGSHVITQGIEDATGTVANYDSVFNSQMNIYQARVKLFFTLQNDAIRFSPIPSTDVEKPTLSAPGNVTVGNDPGANYAVVVVGSATAADNCVEVNVDGTRDDGKPIDAPYPVGVTTITWMATDAAGNSSTASQTVTVLDIEAPVWGDLPTGSVWTRNATSPTGAVVDFDNVPVTDNVGVTSRSCEPASGSFFPIGTTQVTCTASDAAGNTASKSLSVVVISAHEQIGNLIERVLAMNLADGTVEPIVNQLRAAYDQTADGSAACTKMYDFMSMVQKKNSNISSGDAAYMLSEGSRILAVMGCAPALNGDVITPKVRGNH
jgi:hypothetical protein